MKLNNTTNINETKVSLFYRGVAPRALWHSLVALQIGKLQHLASIASARITFERQHQSTPPWRLRAVLEVPGPDFHAEASDYTWSAALLKLAANLRRQMQSRKNRQSNRRKNDARLLPLAR
jgi:ribosome-associated translation inhibitor RaiA